MNYGYIRVSTEKQNTKNQELAIRNYYRSHHNYNVDFITENTSGTKEQ